MACILIWFSPRLDSTPQTTKTWILELTGEGPECVHPSLLSQKGVFLLLESTALGSCELLLRTGQCRRALKETPGIRSSLNWSLCPWALCQLVFTSQCGWTSVPNCDLLAPSFHGCSFVCPSMLHAFHSLWLAALQACFRDSEETMTQNSTSSGT